MNFTGYRNPTVWAELGMMGEKLSFTNDETVTKLGIGYIKDCSAECAMDTAVRYTLLNAGENGEINAKQMLNQYTRLAALVEEGIVADGWYKDEDNETRKDWVYHEDGIRLFWNQVSSRYGYDNTHFSANVLGCSVVDKYDKGYSGRRWGLRAGSLRSSYYGYDRKKVWEGESFNLIPLSQNKRAMSNYLEDKVVLRAINKSLNRMVKSGKAIQVTQGRGRTFRWDAWGWLDRYRQQHLVTLAKQRKLGDKVNGWEYTKGQITNMYGVEICHHEWHPIDPVYTYHIQMQFSQWNEDWVYGFDNVKTSTSNMPYIFFAVEEAQRVLDRLNDNHFPNEGLAIRINGKPIPPKFTMYSISHDLKVKGDAMIEEYEDPLTMFQQMQMGSGEMFRHIEQKLTNTYRLDKMAGTTNKEE